MLRTRKITHRATWSRSGEFNFPRTEISYTKDVLFLKEQNVFGLDVMMKPCLLLRLFKVEERASANIMHTPYSIDKPCQLLEEPENKISVQSAISPFSHPFF